MHFADAMVTRMTNYMTNTIANMMTNMMTNTMANTMANTMIIMTGSKGMYENRDDQFTADQVSPLGKSSQPYGARACQKSQTSTLLFTNIKKELVKHCHCFLFKRSL